MKIKFYGGHGGLPDMVKYFISFSVEDNGFLLVDTGTLDFNFNIELSLLRAILISHNDWDHTPGTMEIRRRLRAYYKKKGEKGKLRIYGPDTLRYKSRSNVYNRMFFDEDSEFLECKVESEIPTELEGFEIEFMETDHHTKTYAYKIRKNGVTLVYTGDTGFSGRFVKDPNYFDKLVDFCSGVDVLITEATYGESAKLVQFWEKWRRISLNKSLSLVKKINSERSFMRKIQGGLEKLVESSLEIDGKFADATYEINKLVTKAKSEIEKKIRNTINDEPAPMKNPTLRKVFGLYMAKRWGHMTVESVIELALRANPKVLVLTHFFSLDGQTYKQRVSEQYHAPIVVGERGKELVVWRDNDETKFEEK